MTDGWDPASSAQKVAADLEEKRRHRKKPKRPSRFDRFIWQPGDIEVTLADGTVLKPILEGDKDA